MAAVPESGASALKTILAVSRQFRTGPDRVDAHPAKCHWFTLDFAVTTAHDKAMAALPPYEAAFPIKTQVAR